MNRLKKVGIALSMGFILLVSPLTAQVQQQTEMPKEEWKKNMDEAIAKKAKLHIAILELEKEIAVMAAKDSMLALQVDKENTELTALIALSEARRREYEELLSRVDAALAGVTSLSRRQATEPGGTLDSISLLIERERADRLSELQEYKDRLNKQQQQLDQLRSSMANIKEEQQANIITVGSWSKSRACLWNIAKQSKVYGNAELWVKIWQANRKQIDNPDIVHPGQKLTIPESAPLTSRERNALAQYYAERNPAPMKTLTQAQPQPNDERKK